MTNQMKDIAVSAREQLMWLMDRTAILNQSIKGALVEKLVLDTAAPLIRKQVVEDKLAEMFFPHPVVGSYIWVTQDKLKGIRPAKIISIELDGYVKVTLFSKTTKRPFTKVTVINAGQLYGPMTKHDVKREGI